MLAAGIALLTLGCAFFWRGENLEGVECVFFGVPVFFAGIVTSVRQ